ncbi:MAG: hypothetical protein ABI204_02415 [Ginsengibacter sp.]
MKIEQVLIHYLLKNKQITLEGIGTFKAESPLPDSADHQRPVIIPAGAISFNYNPKAETDPALIEFITEHTGKIKPLAASDLESYLTLGKQFLNIGNPFILHNIGTLQKNNAGQLIFKDGQYAADKMDPQRKIQDEGAEEHDENMFNEYQREDTRNKGKGILIIVGIIVIGLIIWALYQFVFKSGEKTESVTSTNVISPVADSLFNDSINRSVNQQSSLQKGATDIYTFNVIVGEFDNKMRADKRTQELIRSGRNVIMYTTDSIIYKIAERYSRPLSDTLAVTDSLSRYYGKNRTRIEIP